MIEITPDMKTWIDILSKGGDITVGLHPSIAYEPAICLDLGHITITVIVPENKQEEQIAVVYLEDSEGDCVLLAQLKYKYVLPYVVKLHNTLVSLSSYTMLDEENEG